MSMQDPPITPRDRACAVFARAALFPLSVDWSGKHHAIHPALQALDLMRKDLVNTKNTPFSTLFPRRVMVVPSATGELRWNGQPDIVGSSVEVIPDILTLKCMECSDNESKGGNRKAYIRPITVEGKDDSICQEIVLCTNRLLQSDYSKSSDPTLVEQRRDLPPRTFAVVEEALAHQITKIREQQRQPINGSKSPCDQLAALEVLAARAAECLFQKQGSEVRRGSALKPPGFSLLPSFMQQNFQNRCIQAVATEATAQEFGLAKGKECVDHVFDPTKQ